MFGMNATRKETNNFKKFEGYYLLVEEPSGSYKPVAVKEYPIESNLDNPPWPMLRFENHSAQTVFAARSAVELDEEQYASEDDDDQENQSPLLLDAPAEDVAASGFCSGSVAQNAMRQMGDNPAIVKMTARVHNVNNKREREHVELDIEEEQRVKRSKNYHIYPMVFQKSGYCENCNLKFEDYSLVRLFALTIST